MSQTHEDTEGGSAPSTPRWVKVFGIVVLLLILLYIVLHLAGLSPTGHGP